MEALKWKNLFSAMLTVKFMLVMKAIIGDIFPTESLCYKGYWQESLGYDFFVDPHYFIPFPMMWHEGNKLLETSLDIIY